MTNAGRYCTGHGERGCPCRYHAMLRAKTAAWRERPGNRERHRAKCAEWLERPGNREHKRAKVAEWNRRPENRDPAEAIAKSNRRRARKLNAPISDLTGGQWEDIKREHGHRCHYCGAEGALTQEHLQPLCRGGSHTRANVVPACRACNSSKGDKMEAEYRAYRARLEAG